MAEALHQPGTKKSSPAGEEEPLSPHLLPQPLGRRANQFKIVRESIHQASCSRPGPGYRSSSSAKESAHTGSRYRRYAEPDPSSLALGASRHSSTRGTRVALFAAVSRDTRLHRLRNVLPEDPPSRKRRAPARQG